MFKEFKTFIVRGSVIDLAVGVIIGAAFGKIVTSVTNDVIMPILSLITGKVDFSNLFLTLSGEKKETLTEAQAAGAITLNYGSFLTTVIDFILIAFVIFLMVRQVNRMRKPETVTTKDCPFCRMAISKDATRCPHCTSEQR